MKLHFRKAGEGKPLLILHGLFGSADNWNTLAKKFSEDYLVYAIDLRNHGLSPHSSDWNYEIMANDVLELINDEGLTKVNIIGHSMGGKVAINLAFRNPQLIENLIVVDIAPRYYPPHHQEVIEAILAVDLKNSASRKDAEVTLRGKINNEAVVQFLLKNLYWKEENDTKILAWRMNIDVIAENIEEVGKENVLVLNDESRNVKTTFVKGELSNYITPSDEQMIKKTFSSVEIIEIKNAGHWVQAERPEEFYKIMCEILK
jgi:esterase